MMYTPLTSIWDGSIFLQSFIRLFEGKLLTLHSANPFIIESGFSILQQNWDQTFAFINSMFWYFQNSFQFLLWQINIINLALILIISSQSEEFYDSFITAGYTARQNANPHQMATHPPWLAKIQSLNPTDNARQPGCSRTGWTHPSLMFSTPIWGWFRPRITTWLLWCGLIDSRTKLGA